MKFTLFVVLIVGLCLSTSAWVAQPNGGRSTPKMSLDGALEKLGRFGATAGLGLALVGMPLAGFADGQTEKFSLPPVNQKIPKEVRCVFTSSSTGQANAARDALYDLRLCDLSGKSAEGFDLSGAILSEATFVGANFKDAQLSKAYARDANFDGADFSNGVVDRVSFKGSSMKGAIFNNAVLSGTDFTGANLENSDFTDSYMGDFDQRNLCKNPTLKGENEVTGAPTKESAGCR
ncbi:unnamed protein product [Heterosigma akashiwo]